jgi:hypothetical protein
MKTDAIVTGTTGNHRDGRSRKAAFVVGTIPDLPIAIRGTNGTGKAVAVPTRREATEIPEVAEAVGKGEAIRDRSNEILSANGASVRSASG